MFQSLFLFAADTHLQECAWVRHPRVSGDAYASLRQLGDLAIELKVNLVLGGDIFDKRLPGPDSVCEFMKMVGHMSAAGQFVRHVQGDHDFQPNVSWPEVSHSIRSFPLVGQLWPQFSNVDHQLLTKVIGLDFTPKDLLPAALAALPAADIVVTHQRWHELQGIGNVDGSVSLVHNARLLLTGDYHANRFLQCENAQGKPMLVVSPGSTCMQATDESPDKFAVLVKIEITTKAFEFELIPLKTRGFASVDVHDPAQLDQVVQLLATSAHPAYPSQVLAGWRCLSCLRTCSRAEHISEDLVPMFSIRYRDDLPDAYVRLLAANVNNYYNLDLVPRAVHYNTELTLQETPEGSFDTLLTIIDEMVMPDDPARDGLHRLLTAADKPAALEQLCVEFDAQYDLEHSIENSRGGADELLSAPAQGSPVH